MNDITSSSLNELIRIELENEIKSLNYELDAIKKTKDNNVIYQKKSNIYFLQPSRPILVSDVQTKINEKNKDLDKIKSTINKKKSTTNTTTTTNNNNNNNNNNKNSNSNSNNKNKNSNNKNANTKTNKFKPNIKK